MWRMAAAMLAATMAVGCSGSAESQAQRDPDAPPAPTVEGSDLPLAPDVDPCQLPASVIGLLAGLATDPGTFTATGEAEGQCVYAEADGDQLIVTVDTSGGSAHYDEVNQITAGPDIASVGDEAYWADPTLHVLADGHYWTFTLTTGGTEENRRQSVAIAVAQALEL